MDKLKDLFQAFSDRWGQLSFNQQIVVGTMVAALIFSSVFLFQRAQDDYDVLYSNLSLADAAAVTAKLKEEKQPFKLVDGGQTILVPVSRKNDLVLATTNDLSGESTVNLTEIPPVVSKKVEEQWIKKLNTDAIISVLKSIRGIKNAQVIVSKPEKNLFIEDDEPSTASVMLTVEPGFRIREEQIKTIKNLVSHSVPGLLPENVVISDSGGNSLEGPGGIGGVLSTGESRRKTFEKDTAKKVMSMLIPVVGKENVVVTVSALMNFDQAQTQIHRIIPSGGDGTSPTGVAVSTQKQTEEYAGNKATVGGGAGVESNTTQYNTENPNGQKKTDYKLDKSTTNYELSKEDKTVVYAGGNIERMTIAVVLNKVLTAQETDEIKELVANAAGIDYARGDSIDLKGFQFTSPIEDKNAGMAEATRQAQEQAFYLQLATLVGVILMVIIAMFLFYGLIKQPAEGELVEEEVYESFDTVDELIENTPIPVIEAQLDPEIEHMREAINNAISDDPTEAARLLVAYMKDL